MVLTKRPKVVHQTALRVFALWQWLSQEYLQMHDIQNRLLEVFGEKLSSDSISIYLNTLKRFGCHLSRPTREKGYKITAHRYLKRAFSELTPAHLDALCELAEVQLSFQDYSQWLLMLENIAQWLDVDWKAQEHDIHPDVLTCLQMAIEQSQLVLFSYQASGEVAPKQFSFLPHRLLYKRRRLYVQGARQAYNDLSMLRLSRIRSALCVQDNGILNQLRLKIRYQPYVVIEFPNTSIDQVPSLLSQEQLHFDATRKTSVATFETRDFFSLTQALLSAGQQFRIIQPQSFAITMTETLQLLASHHG